MLDARSWSVRILGATVALGGMTGCGETVSKADFDLLVAEVDRLKDDVGTGGAVTREDFDAHVAAYDTLAATVAALEVEHEALDIAATRG